MIILTIYHFLFQEPNNVISFSIAGDDDADEFFYVHPDNGDITLLQSVFETEKRQYRVCLFGFNSKDHLPMEYVPMMQFFLFSFNLHILDHISGEGSCHR